jgi:ribonuclease-3 family protein
MSPVSSAQPDQMSASSLAYLGDVVFELFIRSRYVWPSRRMPQLQNTVVSLVNAEAQSKLLQKFVDDFKLTSAEQGVLARGRNASLTARKKGKGGESMYQDSTAFEALIGYTYISDKVRFNEMISWVRDELDKMDGV